MFSRTNKEHFFIIAPAGREDVYAAVGLQTFPILSNDYVVTMNFSDPGPALKDIKERLVKPVFSNVAAMGVPGIGVRATNQSSVETPAVDSQMNEVTNKVVSFKLNQ